MQRLMSHNAFALSARGSAQGFRTIPCGIRNQTTDIKQDSHEKSAKPKAESPALEYWERLDICKECPKGSHHIQGYPTKCEECGCLIQAKAMFPIFHCPIGKW